MRNTTERRHCFGSERLSGTDALGRTLPVLGQVPPLRHDRYVGIFYFLWVGQHGTGGPYDITKILAQAPNAVHEPDHPLWGPWHAYHFWGEPLFGYYLADDAWVLRKHVQMLTTASVDFLVFDTTNAVTYKPVYDVLFSILDEVQSQGWRVPQFVFYTNSSSGGTISQLYQDIYQPERYPNLWFQWEGKPLMIGDPDECSEEIRDFFTFRLNQWPNQPQKANGFPWIAFQRPQRVYRNAQGKTEIISVSVAQHPHGAMSDTPFYGHGPNWGRNFHDGENDPSPGSIGWGHNIAAQWEFALDQDPQIAFITGWNEWIAMRFEGPEGLRIRFVDQATQNFSRDIEPMKDGHGDSYYMQMIGHIRQFKGMHSLPQISGHKTIRLNGDFTQWQDVLPEYRDYARDTVVRNHPGHGELTYTDHTGRNDFVALKVARDSEAIYFYARTAQPITHHTDPNWMMLFLNTDGNADTGWEGYNYVINRSVLDASTTLLERSTGGWEWEPVGNIGYEVRGNEMHLAIPRHALLPSNSSKPLRIEFKWSDNMQKEGDIMDFYTHGDTAPDGRLRYVYCE